MYCVKTADWIWLPFGVVSEVGQRMGMLDGWRSSKGKGQSWGKSGAPHYNQWGLRCIVILCLEGCRLGCSQITLGVFVNNALWIVNLN